jgi:hypothetical protein
MTWPVEFPNPQDDRDELRALQMENYRLRELVKAADLVHIRLRAGLRKALQIAWRRGRNEFLAGDSDTLADLRKLLGGES